MNNNKKIKSSNAQFIGWYAAIYFGVCAIFMGKLLTPMIFMFWLLCGWSIARFLTDMFIVGEEDIKTIACLALYFGILGAICLISAF